MSALELIGLLALTFGGAYLLIRWSTARKVGTELNRVGAEFEKLHRAGQITDDEYRHAMNDAAAQRDQLLQQGATGRIWVDIPEGSVADQEGRAKVLNDAELRASILRDHVAQVLERSPQLDRRAVADPPGTPSGEAAFLFDYLCAVVELGLINSAELNNVFQGVTLDIRPVFRPSFSFDPKKLLRQGLVQGGSP